MAGGADAAERTCAAAADEPAEPPGAATAVLQSPELPHANAAMPIPAQPPTLGDAHLAAASLRDGGPSKLLQPVLPALAQTPTDAVHARELWRVFSKVRDAVENGARLENLSWRLWYKSLGARPEAGGAPARSSDAEGTSVGEYMARIDLTVPESAVRPGLAVAAAGGRRPLSAEQAAPPTTPPVPPAPAPATTAAAAPAITVTEERPSAPIPILSGNSAIAARTPRAGQASGSLPNALPRVIKGFDVGPPPPVGPSVGSPATVLQHTRLAATSQLLSSASSAPGSPAPPARARALSDHRPAVAPPPRPPAPAADTGRAVNGVPAPRPRPKFFISETPSTPGDDDPFGIDKANARPPAPAPALPPAPAPAEPEADQPALARPPRPFGTVGVVIRRGDDLPAPAAAPLAPGLVTAAVAAPQARSSAFAKAEPAPRAPRALSSNLTEMLRRRQPPSPQLRPYSSAAGAPPPLVRPQPLRRMTADARPSALAPDAAFGPPDPEGMVGLPESLRQGLYLERQALFKYDYASSKADSDASAAASPADNTAFNEPITGW